MSLADHFPEPPARPCKVGRIAAAMNDEDRDTLTDWLWHDNDVTTTSIAAALALDGHPVSRSALAVHRARACGCK